MNLRARARADMKRLNLKDWSLLAILTAPDGVIYSTDFETGEPLKTIQTLSDTVKFTPDMGEDMVSKVSAVVFARDSLSRVPQEGERWVLQIQFEPDGPLVTKFMDDVRAPEGGASVGFITIFMTDVDQV